MLSLAKKASSANKKGHRTAKTSQFMTKDSSTQRSAKTKPMTTTEEVTLRAFRRTYDRLHPRKA